MLSLCLVQLKFQKWRIWALELLSVEIWKWGSESWEREWAVSEERGWLSFNQGFGESLRRIYGRIGVILAVIGFCWSCIWFLGEDLRLWVCRAQRSRRKGAAQVFNTNRASEACESKIGLWTVNWEAGNLIDSLDVAIEFIRVYFHYFCFILESRS